MPIVSGEWLMRVTRSAVDVRSEGADVAQVAVALAVVEAVADHELVGDVPAHVLDLDRHLQGFGLAEEGADLHAGRLAGAQVAGQPAQGQAGVDDLVDDQNAPPGDVGTALPET